MPISVLSMNKTLVGFFVLASLTSASAASYVGGSIGTGASIHYQQDRNATSAMRYSLDLTSTGFDFGALRIGGSVDYLANMPTNSAAGLGLTPYYGLGLGAGIGIGNKAVGGVVYPHALIGAKYNVSAPLSIFGELGAGPAIGLGVAEGQVGGGVHFGWNARLGVNYMIGQ